MRSANWHMGAAKGRRMMEDLASLLGSLPSRQRRALDWFASHAGTTRPWPAPLPDGTLLVSKAQYRRGEPQFSALAASSLRKQVRRHRLRCRRRTGGRPYTPVQAPSLVGPMIPAETHLEGRVGGASSATGLGELTIGLYKATGERGRKTGQWHWLTL